MSNGVPEFLQFTQSVAAIDIVDILGLYYTSSDFGKEVSPVQADGSLKSRKNDRSSLMNVGRRVKAMGMETCCFNYPLA